MRQPAGGQWRGPSWRAACSHTWLNRDNGSCPCSPASFPQAEPRVREGPEPPPENSPAGSQPEGAQGDFPGRVAKAPGSRLGQGRGPEGSWSPSGTELSGKGCVGRETGLHPPPPPTLQSPQGMRMCHHLLPSASLGSEPGENSFPALGRQRPLVPGLSTELWRPPPLPALTDHHRLCSDDQQLAVESRASLVCPLRVGDVWERRQRPGPQGQPH